MNYVGRKEYVKWYYDACYGNGKIGKESEAAIKFLVNNATGKVLDCGCGPVPQIWAICMPDAIEIRAIDLPKESITFVKRQLSTKNKWYKKFYRYQQTVETIRGKLPKTYTLDQIKKIASVQQSDMTKKLPFKPAYFDTAMSLYSFGVLKNTEELDSAIKNISRVLKKGGKILHINTNGQNSNTTLPEYTWNGLSQTSETILSSLKKHGFTKIKVKKVALKRDPKSTYKYDAISLLSAVKP